MFGIELQRITHHAARDGRFADRPGKRCTALADVESTTAATKIRPASWSLQSLSLGSIHLVILHSASGAAFPSVAFWPRSAIAGRRLVIARALPHRWSST